MGIIDFEKAFAYFASRVSKWTGSSMAFCIAALFILGWAISGPFFGFSPSWQMVVNTVTTIATFLMVFVIQNSQNRDGAAMQAKLDELLRAVDKARGAFIGIEHLTDKEIEKIRITLERETGNAGRRDQPGGPKPKPKAKTKRSAGTAGTRKAKGKASTADESVDRLLDRF